jgi:hypothetical protein
MEKLEKEDTVEENEIIEAKLIDISKKEKFLKEVYKKESG